METQTKQNDGFGNQIQKMNWKEFNSFTSNPGMWMKGDIIQVKNREGCIISTTVLTEDGEVGKRGFD